MTQEPYADVRDMYMAHTMFLREFGLAPELVRATDAGDATRTRIVADHILLVDSVLEHHHHGEDEHLWPRLLTRAGAEAEPVVGVMEEQHGAIEKAVGAVRDEVAAWRDAAAREGGAALAGSLEQLSALLADHLAVEEQQALPLIARHITAAEWGQMVAEGGSGMKPEQMTLVFGMMAYEADPAVLQDIVAGLPPEIGPAMAEQAVQAYARHAQQVYGTSTPPRLGGGR